ncbi:MAG: hypothetical protein EU518_01670, partial [Promethearchaeota archaeon]
MVRELDLKFLEKNYQNVNESDLFVLFFKLIEELEIFLNIECVQKNIDIRFGRSSHFGNYDELDVGVSRKYINNELFIRIDEEYKRFLPIILLREAYLTFIPFFLSLNRDIKFLITQIVELNLKNLDVMDQWKKKTSEIFFQSEFLESQYNRLKDFFELRISKEEVDTSIEFFFQFIRQNLSVIKKNQTDLYDLIFKSFVDKTSKSINNDDIIETLWILIKIFHEVKVFRAIVDYRNYFLEFKEKNKIDTDLSLRDFIDNLRWIRKNTYIGPSYQVNWRVIDVEVFFTIFSFNSLLSEQQINQFIANLPFFYQSCSSENNFSINVFGWFVIPKLYENDLIRFLNRLKDYGFLFDLLSIQEEEIGNFLNLNYFREKFFNKKRIINRSHRAYIPKFEIDINIKYEKPEKEMNLSILDFLILDRVRYYSITGFSFEQRNKALKTLRTDLFYEIVNQKEIYVKFKENSKKIRNNKDIIRNFIQFIESNKKFGFFFITEILKDLLELTDLIIDAIEKYDIKNFYTLQESIVENKLSKNLSHTLKIKDPIINRIIIRDLFQYFFTEKERFLNKKHEFEIFYDFLTTCKKLRIFNLDAILKIIKSESLINRIFLTKEERIKNQYQSNTISDFGKEELGSKLNKYIFNNPPLIEPLLITTISVGVFAKYYIQIIIKKNPESIRIYNQLKNHFPRVLFIRGNEIFQNTEVIALQLWITNITSKEKLLLISIIFNLFKDNLISLRRYFFDGFFKPYSRKDFYDFEKKKFLYTQDLFDQFFRYTKAIFGEELEQFHYIQNKRENLFWMGEKLQLNLLIENVKDRVSREKCVFDPTQFEKLRNLNQKLVNTLNDNNKLNRINKKDFFQQYIKNISFIPNYQKFGYSYYYLYIHPSNLEEIDFKLLLLNTFDQVRYPGYIDKSKSLLINYIFPYRNPNTAYLNWLTKSKRIINEYCLFYIKKLYQLFHFDFNISPEGWDLNPNKFKSYYQNILFNENYQLKTSLIKEYKLGNLRSSKIYSQDSKEFKVLENLYPFHKSDLKTILSLGSMEEIENIEYLLKKELIYPYIDLKNFGLIEEITIILPNIEKDLIPKIVKIFSFFNFGFIYEIEGTYFIKGFRDKEIFEYGLIIQLKLPDCNIGEFIQHFNRLFQHLEIHKYLIISDL